MPKRKAAPKKASPSKGRVGSCATTRVPAHTLVYKIQPNGRSRFVKYTEVGTKCPALAKTLRKAGTTKGGGLKKGFTDVLNRGAKRKSAPKAATSKVRVKCATAPTMKKGHCMCKVASGAMRFLKKGRCSK